MLFKNQINYSRSKRPIIIILAICLNLTCTYSQNEIVHIKNSNGQPISFSSNSGVKILEQDGYSFKDLNRNGKLDNYEDWRLSTELRAKDLASKMSIEQIAGLMLYSSHQSIPSRSFGHFKGTYNGKPFSKSGVKASDLSDQQKTYIEEENLRHMLITIVQSPAIAAEWNNNAQAYCERIGLGIPINNSSDPRHGTIASAPYDAGAGGAISMWPGNLGLAATFNPEIMDRFGQIAAIEYRALGISTALSPQVDIATDPRWSRVSGTFGENPYLSAAMAQAYCDGYQTSIGDSEISEGWGYNSVNTMVKHWPGGGSGEGGRDAHYGMGKYAVYPGNNFNNHLIPFTKGAFQLNGKTKMASAVMPYYTISWGQNDSEQVGNSFSTYIINDLLRDKNNYDGVICTDWNVTHDHRVMDSFIDGKPWGVEELSVTERHYKLIMVGVDQFGGNDNSKPIVEAYELGVKEIGEEAMRARMEQSAVRLLRNIFQVGLFENPYLDIDETIKIVGSPEFMKEGYNAQLRSIVMLKNKNDVLPVQKQKKVYVPKKYRPASSDFLGRPSPEIFDYPVNIEILNKYFKVTDNPDEADMALVFIENPKTGNGYKDEDAKNKGNGYYPISLQYEEYTAKDAREISIAGGDPLENFTNRSYKNKTITSNNITDLKMVTDARTKMKGKPVIVSIAVDNPMVFSEFENLADAIIVGFRVQDQAFLDILTGMQEPSGLLPIQMPANMSTVENQAEDLPQDMKCHIDSEGNVYDFAFGLNWSGKITDTRTTMYTK